MADTAGAGQGRRVSASDDVEVSTYLEIAEGAKDQKAPAVPHSAPPRRYDETVLVVDFGSQYSHLIARRVRECRVYCEIVPHDTTLDHLRHLNIKGIILSGGPSSVYDANAPLIHPSLLMSGLPILGICYGMQTLAHQLGGRVAAGARREYGHALLHESATEHPIFHNLPSSLPVWMSHGDQVTQAPPGFRSLGYTENAPIAVMGNDAGVVGLQFHPEVAHTPAGKRIIENFLFQMCGCHGTWTTGNFIEESVSQIRRQVGEGRVLCALSGGVDSAVVATLVHRAVGDQLTSIFVNNGLLRREEPERVLSTFRKRGDLNLVYVNATEEFLSALRGVVDPEEKRRIIGRTFINVFEREASRLGKVDFLAQGTLYPDVIESKTPESKASSKIKTHHNVGGLPEVMKLSLVEPLRYLFKDEVREVGLSLGLPEEMVKRQPFPGPGLAIRIIGEVTAERLEVLRAADWVVMDEIKNANLYRQLWQSFAILTGSQSVGVMGDHRTYGNVIAVRAVTSEDAMTADWARLPYEVLARISNRIVNEVPQANRVVYDITSKPPGTIEWE
ncbi:MAG: glutamine-hydrolyzing GMP synthase [Dehalococcoidia bacterium]|nr:glutamine-hydrolyzing GMP synthase [Dehalococcoidia bacterium]